MVEHSRYNITPHGAGLEENSILKNKLGITDPTILGEAETVLLSDAYTHFLALVAENKLDFSSDLIFKLHRYFLEPLYSWAGKIRTVDISKDRVLFIPAKYISTALKEFETIFVANSPSKKDTKKKLTEKLAIIHNELNAIHPFREGNGRTIRLLLDLLAVNAGYSPINYALTNQKKYVAACVAGMKRNHLPMQRILYRCLARR